MRKELLSRNLKYLFCQQLFYDFLIYLLLPPAQGGNIFPSARHDDKLIRTSIRLLTNLRAAHCHFIIKRGIYE